MKRNNSTPIWILYILVAISIGISIYAFIIFSPEPDSFFKLKNTHTKFTELTGWLFTIMGVVLTLFFVILGIDASKKRDEMEKIVDKFDKEINERVCKIRELELDNLDTMYSSLILQSKSITDDNLRALTITSLRLSQARLSTQSKFLSLTKRIQRMPDLVELGDESDIEDLRKIIKDPNEYDIIKDMAIGILPLIKDNVKKNSVKPNFTISPQPSDIPAVSDTNTHIALLVGVYSILAALIILIISIILS